MTNYKTDLNYGFNITLGLGNDNKAVNISAEDLSNIETKGLHFQMPPNTEVDLGSLSDLIDWINGKLGPGSVPSEAGETWPTQIQDIFNGILHTNVAVTSLSIDQDKKEGSEYPPLRMDLSVTGTTVNADGVPTPIEIIPDFLQVLGGGISVKREYEIVPESN